MHRKLTSSTNEGSFAAGNRPVWGEHPNQQGSTNPSVDHHKHDANQPETSNYASSMGECDDVPGFKGLQFLD